MTLLELRAAHPSLFYLDQHWYEPEAFANVPAVEMNARWSLAETRQPFPLLSNTDVRLIHAVDLAALYVTEPHESRWRRFIWTDDIDRWGNRVYVSGVGQYGVDAFQVHRKLEPAAWWVRWP